MRRRVACPRYHAQQPVLVSNNNVLSSFVTLASSWIRAVGFRLSFDQELEVLPFWSFHRTCNTPRTSGHRDSRSCASHFPTQHVANATTPTFLGATSSPTPADPHPRTPYTATATAWQQWTTQGVLPTPIAIPNAPTAYSKHTLILRATTRRSTDHGGNKSSKPHTARHQKCLPGIGLFLTGLGFWRSRDSLGICATTLRARL